ncbi:MAG: cell division protein SepF [Firmicutes bacterium]|nr:cell division protein SepF [Bacillota bacterium]
MSTLFNKMLNFVGLEAHEEYEEEEVWENEEVIQPDFSKQSRKSKVVNIHTTAQLKVIVMQPESFDEAKDIADHLKSKKPVVINLEDVEKEIARRIVDFLSGSVYALDGNIQKVSNGIFLVAPYNVDIMGDFKDELRNKGVFPWTT